MNESKKNQVVTQIGFWGAAMCFLGFFLPWVDVQLFMFSVSGNGFVIATKYLNQFAPMRIFLLLIPICSGILIINLLRGVSYTYFHIIKAVPIIVLIIAFIMLLSKVGNMSNLGIFDSRSISKLIGMGFFLTLLGSVMMLAVINPRKTAGRNS